MATGSLDDLHLPASGRGNGLCHFGALVAAVSENPLDEGKAAPGPAQQVMRTVAILNIGSMDAHAEQEAECVDENVALAARNFLARIKALRIECRAPFCAALLLWESMIATLGLSSRPAASRVAT